MVVEMDTSNCWLGLEKPVTDIPVIAVVAFAFATATPADDTTTLSALEVSAAIANTVRERTTHAAPRAGRHDRRDFTREHPRPITGERVGAYARAAGFPRVSMANYSTAEGSVQAAGRGHSRLSPSDDRGAQRQALQVRTPTPARESRSPSPNAVAMFLFIGDHRR
jgi:hypothetical protein